MPSASDAAATVGGVSSAAVQRWGIAIAVVVALGLAVEIAPHGGRMAVLLGIGMLLGFTLYHA